MLRMSAAVKVTYDGNSLVAGAGASVPMPSQVAALAPLAGSGATMANIGVSGQTLRKMNGLDGGSAADVDGEWSSGRRNVLVIWEATNSIHYFGRTVAQGVQDLVDYIAARKAAHPWQVVLLTCLPRFQADQGGVYGKDTQLVAFNARARAEYRSWGADVLVDVRAPGSVFDFDGTVSGNFDSTQSLWAETSEWVHLNDAGYAVVAKWVAAGLRRLPGRAP